jgi:predicted nucleic acid-binding protein
MIRTYVDSNVLIYAATNKDTIGRNAINLLGEANREFVSSPFVKLETIPFAVYNKKNNQLKFFNRFFESVKSWAGSTNKKYPKFIRQYIEAKNLADIYEQAYTLAMKYELGGMDAIHIACAIWLDADEFVTGEAPTKPFFRVQEGKLKIISIKPPAPPIQPAPPTV